MINPELQKDINLEIEKANQMVKDFLLDKYFRDTMDLIVKVNKLTPVQAEGVELETILNILDLSDYEYIEDAIKGECSIENEATVTQVVKDIKDFIFSKLVPDLQQIKVVSDEVVSKPLRNIIQDSYGGDLLGPVALDYYEEKRGQDIDQKPEQNIPTITNDDIMHDVYRELPDARDSDADKIKQISN